MINELPDPQPECSRLRAIGQRSDDDSRTTLLVVHENDGAWTLHGLGAAEVKLSKADTVALVKSILRRGRQQRGRV